MYGFREYFSPGNLLSDRAVLQLTEEYSIIL
jgi:hypothetical protein